jgi:hypothetical protein
MDKFLAVLYDDAFGGGRYSPAIEGVAGGVVIIGCGADRGDARGLTDSACATT